MTDLIIITPSIFNIIKSELTKNAIIEKKYRDLYAKYKCFSNVSVVTTTPILNTRFNRHKTVYNSISKPTNLKKQILGILNVINDSNYLKMFNKIRMIITTENTYYITSELLQKCCLQIFYVHIYLKLFMDIYQFLKLDEKKIMLENVNKYVNDFIIKKEYLLIDKEILPPDTAYDYFCYVQKHKAMINGKNIIILELLKTNILSLKLEDYILYITDELNITICESHIELLLQMLLNIKKSHSTNITINAKIIFDKTNNQKIKFMINDLQCSTPCT
jgi:hypothetical protein